MKRTDTVRHEAMDFVAILVTGLLVISATHADPAAVKAAAEVAIVYLTWRMSATKAKQGPDA